MFVIWPEVIACDVAVVKAATTVQVDALIGSVIGLS